MTKVDESRTLGRKALRRRFWASVLAGALLIEGVALMLTLLLG